MPRIELSNPTLRLPALVFTVVTIMLAVAAAGQMQAAPAQDTVVRCDPTVIIEEIGTTVSFTIYVENAVDVYAGDVQMSFDPTIAEVVDANPSKGGTQIEILDDFLSPDFVVRDRADNVAGTIWYANTQISPAEPVSGSGSLARVTMESLGPGNSNLVITSQELNLINGDPIPSTAGGCQVSFYDPNALINTYMPVIISP